MKAINPKNKIYVSLAIFSLVALTLILFLVYPVLTDVKNISDSVLSDKEQITLLYKQSTELANFNEHLKDYQPNLDKLDALFIDPNDPVNFVEFLEKTASDLGLQVDISLLPNNKDSSQSSQSSFFQVSAKGGFANIITYTQKIESGPYLAKLNDASIGTVVETGKDKKPSTQIQANFLMEVLNKR